MRCLQLTLAMAVGLVCASGGLPAGASAAPTTITEFPVEVGHPSDLEKLVVGSDGNIWFQDHWWPEGSYHALIGRMDEAGSVEEFDEGLSKYSSPRDFVAGPDGNVWFADDGSALGGAAVGRITPGGAITRFTAGLGGSRPQTITVGPEGNLWFTGLGSSPAIGFATPEGAIAAFSLPGKPWDAVGGPDGNIWFTYGGEGVTPAIGQVVLKEGGGAVITLFHSGLAAGSHPYEIIAAQNGYLWFSDWGETSRAIGRVSMSGEIQEFRTGLKPESGIWDLAAGAAGDVWFTDSGADDVGRISPQGQITELGNGELVSPRYITPGADGNMWFTYWGGIGKVSPSGQVTRLREGLGSSASPQEIVSGPGGRLWFISNSWSAPAIGRIIPGDDSPALVQEPSGEPAHSPFAPGRLALPRATIPVSRSGRATLRFTCQSAIPCSGKLRLTGFRRGWSAGRLIWASPFSIGAWASAGVRVQLNHAGRKLIATDRDVTVKLEMQPVSEVLPVNQRLRLRVAPGRRGDGSHQRDPQPFRPR